MERSGPRRRGRYGREEFRGPPRAVPVEEGKEYHVRIESVGTKGDGIAKIEGFIVFVPGTKVGDELTVRVDSIRGRFAIATPMTQGERQ
ncbi:MAG: TRAM domain-containing protein [Candidatus Bathyarchaeia archaeon]